MHVHDGYNSHGLDLWLRNIGSKGELFPPETYGMDAETAHYYHVLLSYVYLVNAAVQRGHMNLTLVTGYWA